MVAWLRARAHLVWAAITASACNQRRLDNTAPVLARVHALSAKCKHNTVAPLKEAANLAKVSTIINACPRSPLVTTANMVVNTAASMAVNMVASSAASSAGNTVAATTIRIMFRQVVTVAVTTAECIRGGCSNQKRSSNLAMIKAPGFHLGLFFPLITTPIMCCLRRERALSLEGPKSSAFERKRLCGVQVLRNECEPLSPGRRFRKCRRKL
jgi:hypothetical protein